MFLDGCSGLCLVNLSRGWLILGGGGFAIMVSCGGGQWVVVGCGW